MYINMINLILIRIIHIIDQICLFKVQLENKTYKCNETEHFTWNI